jgi:hypothetical protein
MRHHGITDITEQKYPLSLQNAEMLAPQTVYSGSASINTNATTAVSSVRLLQA